MDWNGVKALVTGGAGFVPSHIVDALVARGAIVTVMDNLQAGREENLNEVCDRITFLPQDIRDPAAVREAVAGQELVFHLAANASVPASVSDPRYDLETNSVGTFNILEAAKESGVRRVVYASSAAVYGNPQYVPTDEQHPLQPTSFYGISKLNGERLGLMYHQMFDLGFTAFRIFNTYGPRQPRYVLADLVRKLMKDPHRLEVLGTGEQVRDYAFATDTASAFIAAAEIEAMNGDVFNLAGGNPVSIKQLVAIILKVMDLTDCEVHYTGKSWQGDITHLEADIGKITAHGFSPRVGLEEGIRTTIASGTIVGESEF
ncbi:MAG: NAD-dependent epimerase/dehydratase family protein [bacterium]